VTSKGPTGATEQAGLPVGRRIGYVEHTR